MAENQNTIFIQSHDSGMYAPEEDSFEFSEEEVVEKYDVNVLHKESLKEKHLKLCKIHCNEPSCDARFKIIKAFRDHLEQVHNYEMRVEKLSFDNIKEFENWRNTYEQENCCSFVKRTGSRIIPGKQAVSTYMYCSRSGIYESKSSARIKKSKRCGLACTASIIYKELPHGEISVTLHASHYGHELDVKQLRLSKHDKQSIAHALCEGNSPVAIIDKMRASTGAGDVNSVNRMNMISRKEVRTVEKLLNVINGSGIPGTCIEKDFVSLDVWCAELSSQTDTPSPVIYYKPLGYKSDALTSYDLCLILMTDHMRKMLTYFGDNLIYVTTLPIPKIQYYTTLLFILDEVNTPFPVLIMITNKMAASYLKVMFDALNSDLSKHKIHLNTKVLMTDRNDAAYSLWNDIMHINAKHMVCPRHCDSEWRKYMATITNEELQDEIYDQLCELLEPKDHNAKELLDKVLTKMESNELCSKFVTYFKKFYAPCFDQWGGHVLKELLNVHTALNFEKTVSEIQETLDAKYKKYAKNVVKMLQQLLKRLVTYQYARTSTLATIRNTTDFHHRISLSKDMKKVYPTENEKEWQVVLDTKETVTQTKEVHKCCSSDDWECSIVCTQCNVCIHEYKCTCQVYTRQTTICVHIHLVVGMMRHTLLSGVLEKNNTALTHPTTEASIKLEPMEVLEDESSVRKAIIQSLNNTQDKLYLIKEMDKLKSLLNIAQELHTLTCEMDKDKTKGKATGKQKVSPVTKRGSRKNSKSGITDDELEPGEISITNKGLLGTSINVMHIVTPGGKVNTVNKEIVGTPAAKVNLMNQEIGTPRQGVKMVTPVLPAGTRIEKKAASVPCDLSPMIQNVDNKLKATNQTLVMNQKELRQLANKQVVVGMPTNDNVLYLPSQNIEIFLDENKNPEEEEIISKNDSIIKTTKIHSNDNVISSPQKSLKAPINPNQKQIESCNSPTLVKPNPYLTKLVVNEKYTDINISKDTEDTETLLSPEQNEFQVDYTIMKPTHMESPTHSNPKKPLQTYRPQGVVQRHVSKPVIKMEGRKSQEPLKPLTDSDINDDVQNEVSQNIVNISQTEPGQCSEPNGIIEPRKNLVETKIFQSLQESNDKALGVDNKAYTSKQETTLDKITPNKEISQIVTPGKDDGASAVGKSNRASSNADTSDKAKAVTASPNVINRPSVTNHPNANNRPSVTNSASAKVISWDIEIAWQNKKILIPLFNDPKTGIEKIIQKLNAGHFVYKNEKDKRGDIISANKPSIIEQLTVILKMQNPDCKIVPPKPSGPVCVKLLEHQEPLTLKRKIEEFSQQIKVKKENTSALVVNQSNQKTPDLSPKKIKTEPGVSPELENIAQVKPDMSEEVDVSQRKLGAIPREFVPNEMNITSGAVNTITINDSRNVTSVSNNTPMTTSNDNMTSNIVPFASNSTSEIESLSSPEIISKQESEKPIPSEPMDVCTPSEVSDSIIKETKNMPYTVAEPKQISTNKQFEKIVKENEKISKTYEELEGENYEDEEGEIDEEEGEKYEAEEMEEDDFEEEEEDPEDPNEDFPEVPTEETSSREKTIPRRVVRTLRPEVQNKFNSSHNKGCLKVLKPCIR
ncbi:hypothetical protein WDU94_008396 [Cyamophila willieti]